MCGLGGLFLDVSLIGFGVQVPALKVTAIEM